MVTAATKTDVGADEWPIDDAVCGFRVWASDVSHPFPQHRDREVLIGSSRRCAIALVDPHGLVSRQHARVTFESGHAVLNDMDSKNGLRIDGALAPVSRIVLEPGMEIGIGGVRLVAESTRFIELRGFVCRTLGWGSDRLEAVDLALRAIRKTATRRASLVLSGEGDLAALARDLFRRALGPDRPFVVCDRRRLSGKATVRSAENYSQGMPALRAAAGGTLCVWSKRLPRDFSAVSAALRDPGNRVRLVACTNQRGDGRQFLCTPIEIPSLATRPHDLVRIINEYASDARARLGAAPLADLDREWVAAHSAAALPDIAKGTLRLLAIRKAHGDMASAARLLGMSRSALARWLGRRRLPDLLGR